VIIQENLQSSGNGNINALVVRALPSLQLNCQRTSGGQLQLQRAQGALLGGYEFERTVVNKCHRVSILPHADWNTGVFSSAISIT